MMSTSFAQRIKSNKEYRNFGLIPSPIHLISLWDNKFIKK